MESSVSKRGQTTIPARIRKRYNIKDGDRIAWLDDGKRVWVIPLPAGDPVELLRGSGRGQGLSEALLRYRRRERGHGS
jgi:AbrB family looped-hinge helix DNA binding protein